MPLHASSSRSQFRDIVFSCSLSTVAIVLSAIVLSGFIHAQDSKPECVILERVLPPIGLEIPSDRKYAWLSTIGRLETQLAQHRSEEYWADIAVLLKACRFAVEDRELYTEKDFAKVDRLLKLADEKLKKGAENSALTYQAGLHIRGFQSKVDGSVQPVGLYLPKDISPTSEKRPLYVWLHGRGDKSTDLHFLCERLDKKGEVAPEGAIVLHPFGRHCVGYKNAGSTDVMEAIDFVTANYPIDTRRIVLIGFSMGGAGVWHLAARYTDRFVAASPGAGFAETAQYQNLTPDKFPPKYEQILWSVYDVPGYTKNLFNLPVIAYSGEEDKQIQAARVMESAFKSEGRELTHLIGPGMGHKYHPEVLKDLLNRLAIIAKDGQPSEPTELSLQTRHWHFAKRQWIRIDGIQEQYADTRVDAKRDGNKTWSLTTKNVSRIEIQPPYPATKTIQVDGASFPAPQDAKDSLKLVKADAQWQTVQAWPTIRKHTGISGPIDDAFFSPFLFVKPSGKSAHQRVSQWAECEMQNAIVRWRTLMRGEPRVKLDTDVSEDDLKRFHVVCWGDPQSNRLLGRLLQNPQSKATGFQWTKEAVHFGAKTWDAKQVAPVLIMPNPEVPYRYLVVNSGLTFRQAHDRTNSLQNPHLPDWAVVGLDEPPTASSPGKILRAGFFNDSWQVASEFTFEQ